MYLINVSPLIKIYIQLLNEIKPIYKSFLELERDELSGLLNLDK